MAVRLDRIYVGPDNAQFVDISDPLAAHGYFSSAISGLPPSGGFELYVTPGSSSYVFSQQVLVDRPNVTIRFSPGAELRLSGSTTDNLFLVSAPGFRCEGARVVHSITATDYKAGRSLFRVDDLGNANASDGAVFEDCVFHVDQQIDDVESFTCIRSVGASAGSPRRGLDVRGCTFFLSAEGVAQADAWSGTDPYGLCAIRSLHTRGCLLSRNQFRGIDVARGSHCGPMVILEGSPDAVLAANVFRNLETVPANASATERGTLFRVSPAAGQEGHRTVLASNVFENIGAQYVIELHSARGDVLAFSNFGRILDADAAVRTSASAESMRGVGLALVGNNFHNVARVDREMVRLEGLSDAVLAGNALVLFDKDEQPFHLDPGTCENLHVAAGQSWGR